ncbi:MAG: hypothetical protein IPH23_12395 [Gammaproteobacteria bacterium]|nr:hypothetical protein [Gammaproteobacteria bacterium]
MVANADEITALLVDGREAEAAVADADPETDLAALRIASLSVADAHRQLVAGLASAMVLSISAIRSVFGQSVSQGTVIATAAALARTP